MRIGVVIGRITINRRLAELKRGQWLLVETLDRAGLEQLPEKVGRVTGMGESLVVFDELGAGEGQMIALSEGREASMPFYPANVPIDAYCAAILDTVEITDRGAA